MEPEAAVENRLREIAERDRVPSLVVLAARDGRETLSFATGLADRERGRAPGGGTVYGLGSVSKSVLALAAMRLARAGRLDLHRPVADVLGRHPALDGVTAHHLLTHTSGLPPLDSRYWALDRTAPDVWSGGVLGPDDPPRTLPDPPPPGLGFVDHRGLLDYLDSLEIVPLGPPGTHLSYSNEGYVLLSGVVAEACEAPYHDAVRELALEPLGLRATALIGSPEANALDDVAVPYARRGADLVPVRWWDAPAWDGPGGVLASARDVLALAEHLRLDGEGVGAVMSAPHAATTPAGVQHYGYGLYSSHDAALGGARVVGHSGGRIGTAAHMAWIPDRGVAVAALCNVAGGPAAEAARVALAWLCGAGVDVDPTPAAHLPRLGPGFVDVPRILGAYHSGEAPTGEPALVVEEVQGAVGATVTAAGRNAELRPVTADRWVEDGAPAGVPPLDVHFLADGAGPAWGVATGLRILTRERRFRRR